MKNGVDLKQLKAWIIENYGKKCKRFHGKKCKDFNPFCPCCVAWRIYEDLKEMLEL